MSQRVVFFGASSGALDTTSTGPVAVLDNGMLSFLRSAVYPGTGGTGEFRIEPVTVPCGAGGCTVAIPDHTVASNILVTDGQGSSMCTVVPGPCPTLTCTIDDPSAPPPVVNGFAGYSLANSTSTCPTADDTLLWFRKDVQPLLQGLQTTIDRDGQRHSYAQ